MEIISRRLIWYTISATMIIIGLFLIGIFRLRLGIDFIGGSTLELKNEKLTTQTIQETAGQIGLDGLITNKTGEGTVLIRMKQIDESKKKELVDKLKGEVGETQELRFETVGPTVSKELTKKAIISVIVASLAIIAYIAWAFRRVSKPVKSWVYGLLAVITLVHDLAVTVGLYAAAGRFFSYEVDSLFITGLLTVMGFSVHDTIVVYDRIRENLRLRPQLKFDEVVNESVVQTFTRSLNTSLTILLTLATLFLLGGETIKGFIFTLFFGIFVGTYSSIFIASPLLVSYNNTFIKSPR